MPLQTEHQTELLKFIAPEILESEDLEQAKQILTSTFIKKSEAAKDEDVRKQVSGSLLGKLDTFVNQQAKQLNVEFDEGVKSGKLEDKLSFLTTKVSENLETYKSQIDKGVGDDFKKKLELEYQAKIEKLNLDLQTKTEMLDNTVQKLTSIETEYKTKERNRIITDAFTKAKSEIQFSPEADNLKLKGFEATFNEKYKVDLDENNSVIVLDSSTNKPIQNPNKMNDFLGLSDVLKKEAEENNLLQKAAAAGSKVAATTYKSQQGGADVPPSSPKIAKIAMGV
jgi:hypothetical protein